MFNAPSYGERRVPVAIMQYAKRTLRKKYPRIPEQEIEYMMIAFIQKIGYKEPSQADFNALAVYDRRGVYAPGVIS